MEELLVYRNGNKEYKIKIGDSDKPVTYQVVPMFDASALDGFQKHRTTKILDPNVYNRVRLVTYDTARKTYDTGLTKNSKVLSQLYPEEEERRVALQKITKYITNPLAELYGLENLDPKNLVWWDNFTENIELDASYNTSDSLQLAKLYFLISHGKLCPIEFESEPYYKGQAQYAVENKDAVVNVGQKRKLEISKAKSRFITLLENDKIGLTALLEWMGITGLTDNSDELMNDIFTSWLEKDDNQNPKAFLETYDNYYKSESGKKELIMFKELKSLHRNKKIVKEMSGFYLNGQILGNSLKDSVKNVLKDDTLLEKVYAALDS